MIISIWSLAILTFSVNAELSQSKTRAEEPTSLAIQAALNHAIVSQYVTNYASNLPLERKRRFFKKIGKFFKKVGKKVWKGVKKVAKYTPIGFALGKAKKAAVNFFKKKLEQMKTRAKTFLIKKFKELKARGIKAVKKILLKVLQNADNVIKSAMRRVRGNSRKYGRKKSGRNSRRHRYNRRHRG